MVKDIVMQLSEEGNKMVKAGQNGVTWWGFEATG